MTKRQERVYLEDTIIKALQLNIANCCFLKKINESKPEILKVLDKSIDNSVNAISLVKEIVHLEILRAIYNDYVNKISTHLVMGGSLVCSPKIQEWDKTESGFTEFTIANKEAIKLAKKKAKEQEESREAIRKAQEQGKKVQMLVDPITKQVKPVIENDIKA